MSMRVMVDLRVCYHVFQSASGHKDFREDDGKSE